ncbi:hypothetical protein HF521_012541 [Silurus meridionalis]|uniref:C-type lectin domain-containing protein n=1 Tax=Silurus meridionalis TaxID=175797 RepID=A0A8T0ADF3_SILME|nr:hypothetical protein HF521_012541 [Silurus meridionalis]
MRLNLFLLLCLSGLNPITNLPAILHNYTFIPSVQTWPVAQNYCRTFYHDLATISTSDDQAKIMALAAQTLTGQAWVGLYNDISSWQWSFPNISLIRTGFSQWYSGQPDNADGNQSCGAIHLGGYWHDIRCTYLKPFICYNSNYSDAERFVGVTTPLSWMDAQAYCQHFHTDLASAINSSDNSELSYVVSLQGFSWFGLHRDTWKWSDGTQMSNVTWLSGQPNNYFKPENCGSFNNGFMSDELCIKTSPSSVTLVIIPVRKHQIMNFQVLSDGTGFNPAFQLTFLQLINLKLKEHDMLLNSAVRFRLQPDGNLFYRKRKYYP